MSPGWKLDRKVEEGMVCGGKEGEGTGPNHCSTGMLRDRRVFIFKRQDNIIVIIIIVRELITPFRSKNYGHCLFPFFFPLQNRYNRACKVKSGGGEGGGRGR